MDGHPAGQALPLDVRATAFQRRVWQHLTTIPRGETRTYGQVAQDLGEPKSARAVAQACAANPVALMVPCHRVVRQDGAWVVIAGVWNGRQPFLKGKASTVGCHKMTIPPTARRPPLFPSLYLHKETDRFTVVLFVPRL